MSKVINLFEARDKQEALEIKESVENFDQVMLTNKQNEERLRKERLQANKSVLRSYRIKN
jgi:predicted HAD superfamily phosphohydrolase